MFRRLPHSLPPDPTPPVDLAALGCFINGEDKIRLIREPEHNYHFRVDRNERYNEVYHGALYDYIQKIVQERLLQLDVEVLRLPLDAKETDQHVPIYVSKNWKKAKRILVLFGQRHIDAGMISYGAVGNDGLNASSAIDLINGTMSVSSSTVADEGASTGIILTNPCQLIWYRGERRAIGEKEWLSLSRQSAVHGPFRIDPVHNRIPGNKDYAEHVEYVFEHVLKNMIQKDAKLDIIGMEYTGMEALQYLAGHWDEWAFRVNGICLGNPQHTLTELKAVSNNNPDFINFIRKRTRGYFLSDAQIETPMAGIEKTGCNCYSSGEALYEDGILIRSWKSMVDWFNLISNDADYEEPTFAIIDVDHSESWI